jgi:hypothetical protein
MAGETESLETELRIFEERKSEWLRSHLGDFVVIAGTTVAGFYSDYEKAYNAGLQRFGIQGEFLVKQLCTEEPVYLIY